MKLFRQATAALIALSCLLLPFTALANSAEPPGLIIIVPNPTDDLALYLDFPDSDVGRITLERTDKAWEAYYKFFYHTVPMGSGVFSDGATLTVEAGGESYQWGLPTDLFDMYNNTVTVDINAGTLMVGQSPWRTPLLVALRVVLTLVIEGCVFLLFGYRRARSLIIFLAMNLVTQGVLNALLTGPTLTDGSYWVLAYLILEVLVIVIELCVALCLIKEHKKGRAALCVVVGNLASLVLGGLLIAYLPV